MGRKRGALDGLTAAGLIAAIVMAGCSAAGQGPGAAASASASVSSTTASSAGARKSAGSSAAPSASPSTAAPTFAPPGPSGSIADAAGDATPGYLDAVRLSADSRGGHLDLALTLAAPVPASSVSAGILQYDFSLDTNGDGAPDAVASLENLPEGGFRPVLTDTATGHRLEGADFPGTAGLAGAEVTVSLTLDAIGCPAVVAIRASTGRTRSGSTTRDEVPETAAAALTVSTGC